MRKRLVKSRDNKKLCGVCGGLANFLEIDATIVRLIWVLSVLFLGIGLLLYFVMALIIPYED